MRNLMMLACLIVSTGAWAATPQEMLKTYEPQAKKENTGFAGFSAERGAKFFSTERMHSSGKMVSCATCHTADPKAFGKTRANKQIEPLAPIANPQRFTDPAKVEKWFGRNCKDVLERSCTAQEKGDFIQYLVNIK